MTRKRANEPGRDPRRRHTAGADGEARAGLEGPTSPAPAAGPPRAAGPPKAAERVAKVMARAGLCSRRDAEEWIKAGRVAVNRQVISSPAVNVSPDDTIEIDGKPLPRRERTRLFLYHKPRGLMTTHADPDRRPTIFDALPKHLPRLVSVGRLDVSTEGLLLLTNDGGLARTLELPRTGWLRRYRVRAHGRVTQAQLDALKDGTVVDGIRYGPIEATLDREQGSNVWLTFAIREGKNREVRNVLGALGLEVNRLIRTSFGPFQLGEIPDGGIEEVKTRTLREQLGERIAAAAGADFDTPPADRETAEPAATPGRTPRKPAARAPAPAKGRPGRPPDRSRGDHPPGPDRRPKKFVTDRRGRQISVEHIDADASGGRGGHSARQSGRRRPGRRR